MRHDIAQDGLVFAGSAWFVIVLIIDDVDDRRGPLRLVLKTCGGVGFFRPQKKATCIVLNSQMMKLLLNRRHHPRGESIALVKSSLRTYMVKNLSGIGLMKTLLTVPVCWPTANDDEVFISCAIVVARQQIFAHWTIK